MDFNISSNTLRHTWNYIFTEYMEDYLASRKLSEAAIECYRNYLMGREQGANSAKGFTQGYQKEIGVNHLITSKYKKYIEGSV